MGRQGLTPAAWREKVILSSLIRYAAAKIHTPIKAALGALFCVAATAGAAQTPSAGDGPPRLKTNQDYIEQAARTRAFDIDDPMAVFGFVFDRLPARVKVYPTENYYYFSFLHGGVEYAGNLRLDAFDRDKGTIHFAYFRAYTGWRRDEESKMKHQALGPQNGVKVEKQGQLAYRVSYKAKSVLFQLNDLSDVRPPKGLLHDNEIYLGPVFDESGIEFFLIFNPRVKVFHYILNETGALPDQLYKSKVSERIVIGERTGFAFYEDRRIKRKILVGVYAGNGNVNNYLDGPFDQLPDNFLTGDALRQAILQVEPELAGQIDRFGNSADKVTRYLIGPYLYYEAESDLAVFDQCATSTDIPPGSYYACFEIMDMEGR